MEETKVPSLEKAIGYIKTNWKKVAIIALAVVIAYNFFSCGGKEDNDDGGLKANTWYTYDALDILHIQNCVVSNATTIGDRGVMVTYYPVCKSCREHGALGMAGPEYNYPVSETYYCDACGTTTTVKFKVEY